MKNKNMNLLDPATEKFLFVMSLISIIIVISAVVYISNKVKQDKKIDEIKIEQTRKNAGIAEGLLEKELNKDKKYFQLSNTNDDEILSSSTSWIWTDSNLICHVLVDGESYKVYFKTNKLVDSDNELEMYEPVAIDKIIKIKKQE
ncbi:hypothetical protein SIM55_23145 [Bacillus cereus group sp. BfR-BA-02675]|uniref:hypothetical protein n=1 Tax=Bacillus cereus group TaxID=86661 RepID=UPI000BBA026B|nr:MULTISPECIES: hypothetical protein [Bacillus cereus group]PCC77287.1 hypothetical protein CNQ76_23365 [Bacillus cereus]MCC2475781.1 hypothetical protein [Bacillus paranthracis]MDX5768590.1 hypothetical protein [Bacillus cereus group sp. BfR-BA-02675]MDX5891512.1 hypothetical protein [Bacillus cereus group sp. BfR-BA-01039]PDR74691.1 hypothetical protein CNQ81_22870 [Bacillus cereus]